MMEASCTVMEDVGGTRTYMLTLTEGETVKVLTLRVESFPHSPWPMLPDDERAIAMLADLAGIPVDSLERARVGAVPREVFS